MARLLLFTGKGGTGKTTLAAATATRAAAAGLRTLVVSTDGAHSLGDVFGHRLTGEPTEIAPNLAANEIDVQAQLDSKWTMISSYLEEVVRWAGADPLRAGELAVVPGLEQLLALEQLSEHARGDWDLIVVDCAPTAETVRLLALPSALQHYLTRILPGHRRLVKRLTPMIRHNESVPPAAPPDLLETLLSLAEDVNELHRLLTDPSVTSVRLVTNAEAVVAEETRRAWSLLTAFQHHVDAIIINQLMPRDDASNLVRRIRSREAAQLAVIDDTFSDLRRFPVELRPDGVSGLDDLSKLAAEVFGEERVDRPFGLPKDASLIFEEDRLLLGLRGARPAEVQVRRSPRTIQVTLGSFRRIIDLPERLRQRQNTSGSLRGEDLEVTFEDNGEAKP